MIRKLFVAAAALWLMAGVAQAEPRTLSFDGQTLTEGRKGTEKDGAFVEFTRRQGDTRELLLIRSVANRVVKDELKTLVADIRKRHPKVKLRMLEKTGGNDVMVVYLLTPDKGDPSLVLWRLTQSGAGLIAAIYRIDFSLDDEDATERVMNRSPEQAFAKLDPAELQRLLPAAN
jgi:hypothetical protein